MLEAFRPGQPEPPPDAPAPAMLPDVAARELVVGGRCQPPRPAAHLGKLVSIVGALAMHAALGVMFIGATEDRVGAGGTDLEAVSVEVTMVQASALESRARNEAQGSAGSTSVDLEEGLPAQASTPGSESSAPELEEATSKPPDAEVSSPDKSVAAPETQPPAASKPANAPVVAPPPEIAVSPDNSPDVPDALTLPEATTRATEVEPPKMPPKSEAEPPPPPKPPRTEAEPPARPARAAPSGGAAARHSAAIERPVAAAAVASPGAVNAFNRSVVAALARKRPKGLRTRRKGTVRIAFAIGENGGLAFVRIAKSSGSRTLDQAALSAIESAEFLVPPPGMSLDQRTYEVPYHFR